MKIQIEDLKGKSAFDYCRHAIGDGRPAGELLEVYRGDMLSYTVTSLEWGARHVILENGEIGPSIGKFRPMTEKDKERLKKRREAKKNEI